MEGTEKIYGHPKMRKSAPAIDPEEREKQLISLAISETERKLRSGNAPTALLMHYLRLATAREKLEKEKLRKEIALLEAKKNAVDSTGRMEELVSKAIQAMTEYGSSINQEDEEPS